MNRYAHYVKAWNEGADRTPQSRPISGREQDMARNNQGGYSFKVGDWSQLMRFLITGSERGSYYADGRELTLENCKVAERCLGENGCKVVDMLVDVSTEGRAPKNDPALLVLAMALQKGDLETRQFAAKVLPLVARTGTHELMLAQFTNLFGGWGRLKRSAHDAWYNGKAASDLAYQLVKYRQRGGWSHRDVLRLVHPVPATPQHKALYHWVTKGWESIGPEPHPDPALKQVWAFERAQLADKSELLDLITEFSLTWEMLPSQWLTDKDVWRTLLYHSLPKTALLRNLSRLTRVGIIKPLDEGTDVVIERLTDGKGRLPHPMSTLLAMGAYQLGRDRRGNTWEAHPDVIDALETLFYQGFRDVKPTGKRTLVCLDVSGSMTFPEHKLLGTNLTSRDASAAMAMVTVRTEPRSHVCAFSANMIQVSITRKTTLQGVIRNTSDLPHGGTNCSAPMEWALKKGLEVDTFVIYTDNETRTGRIHPSQALQQYRNRTGIPAKLIVVAMASNRFSIADPLDPGMLDVVGFDSSAPAAIAAFSAAEL